MNDIVPVILATLATGLPLFLIASGLTLIFSVMRVLNFAHGALFMIGAFLVASLLSGRSVTVPVFAGAVLVVGLAVAVLSVITERVVFRRLYGSPEVVGLLASFALLLILNGLVQLVWGSNPRTLAQAHGLGGVVGVFGNQVASYNLVLIVVAAVIGLALAAALRWTRAGAAIKATADDRVMAEAMGVNVSRVALGVFAVGGLLAGLAGSMLAPTVSIDPSLALTFIIQSFGAIIIGGLGSVEGAVLGALLISLVDAILVYAAPGLLDYGVYIAIGAVMLVRPYGIFGAAGRRAALA
ncbi:MAG: branched-chain amino acid ABC transporter permease [Actinomycetota bacterium]|nr:branched-chain amino acid ABC transporter permease [Actinomycetota bacterium]